MKPAGHQPRSHETFPYKTPNSSSEVLKPPHLQGGLLLRAKNGFKCKDDCSGGLQAGHTFYDHVKAPPNDTAHPLSSFTTGYDVPARCSPVYNKENCTFDLTWIVVPLPQTHGLQLFFLQHLSRLY